MAKDVGRQDRAKPGAWPRDAEVVLGLGSNLGDRAGNLRQAVVQLTSLETLRLLGSSGIFESPPAGGPPQGDYLNAAIHLATPLSLREVLDQALATERRLGRIRTAVRWSPRIIDIDLLFSSQGVLDEPGLHVPHPRLTERPFALQPLLELIPDAVDPRSGLPYAELPAATAELRRLGPLTGW